LGIGWFDKHAVVAADDLIGAIDKQLQEIIVRRDNDAIHGEFDKRAGSRNSGQLARVHNFLAVISVAILTTF
jgi:hypothetical protein